MKNAVTRACAWISLALLTNAPLASAQSVETFAGGRIFTDASALGIPALPVGVAVSPDGNIWTNSTARLLRFDPVTGTVTEPYARFETMDAGAFDAAGNLYYVMSSEVYRVEAVTGERSVFAGNGYFGNTGNGGPATSASLGFPRHIAFDAAGNLYIPDAQFGVIRVVDTGGYIHAFAGNGSSGASTGDGGPALYAGLDGPNSVAFDGAGNAYVSERGGRIRKIAADTGIITTIAGTGEWGFNGDGIPALQANITQPTRLAFDAFGNLLVNDQGNNRIRSIDLNSGLISTIAGNGISGFSGDGGPATAASWNYVEDFALDAAGNLYIGDYSNLRLRRVDRASGIIDSVVGNGTQGFCGDVAPRLESCLLYPDGLALAANGDLYIADSGNGRVRKVTQSDGMLATYAGNGTTYNHSGDGGPALNAGFGNYPDKVALDAAGNLLISSVNDHRIRRVNATTGIITTVAGVGISGFSGDGGAAQAAKFNRPFDVISDGAGNIFVADSGNNRIRRIDAATGIITTFAGSGLATGPLGDGGLAINASLKAPTALAFDAAGNLLISDREHFLIRRIDAATGIITTIAGNGTVMPSGDGGPALAAGINAPDAIALDAAGNIFIGTYYGVRRINAATGIISALPMGSARSLRFDAAGDLYASDTSNNRIVRVAGVGAAADSSAPVITPHAAGNAGNNGWFRGDVQVTWTVTDAESGIDSSSGCTASSVTSDTAGATFTCTATSAGGTASKSITIMRDAQAPTITFGALSPEPDAAGWNSGDVMIPYATSDSLSGVYSTDSPNPLVVTGEGNALGVPVVVTDFAGNSATFRSPPVRIDRTPPFIIPTITGPAGNDGWYRGNVQLTWSAPDGESPLHSYDCPAQTVTADTAGVTFTCTATSAGGTATQSITIKRDATPPTLQWGAFSPIPNTNGWNKTNVTVSFTRADATSGVASVSATSPLTLGTEGAGVTGQVTVTDNAGNAQTFTTDPRNIDKTPPVVSIIAPANGATYGFYQDVIADYACTDVSLLSCTGTNADGAFVNTKVAGVRTFKVTAKDSVAFTTSVTNTFNVASTFNFDGFLGGAAPSPTPNLVPKGSLVPIRWRLPDGNGGFVTSTASFASVAVTTVTCPGSPVSFNDLASGGAGISFDPATNQFTYNWQTGASWSGCRKLTVKLKDGGLHELIFKFQ